MGPPDRQFGKFDVHAIFEAKTLNGRVVPRVCHLFRKRFFILAVPGNILVKFAEMLAEYDAVFVISHFDHAI
ncbi:hypothetical protein D1872_272080 [compost metagenome]